MYGYYRPSCIKLCCDTEIMQMSRTNFEKVQQSSATSCSEQALTEKGDSLDLHHSYETKQSNDV